MKCHSAKLIGIIFISFILGTLFVKSSNFDIKVRGKVINKETKAPIEFVNIYIKDYQFGTISNIEGDFVLNIPAKYQKKKIILSCIGYKSDTIIITNSIFEKPILFELTPEHILLAEVTIKPIKPLAILRESLKRVPENYSNEPVYLNAYYREMVKVDTAFVKYSDAACKIYYCGYNNPYNKKQASEHFFETDYNAFLKSSLPFPQAKHTTPHQNDAVKVIETRKSNNLENFKNQWGFEESLKKFDIGGGPLHITAADIVKLNEDFLDSISWKYYRFKLEGTLEFNYKEAYKISFCPKKNNELAMWEGSMYIDKLSFAFIAFEYSANENCKKYLKDKNVEHIIELSKSKTIKQTGMQSIKRITEHTDQSVRVNYTFYNNKWYLTHIKIENTYKNKGDLFEDINYETYLELFVNDIETKNVTPFTPDSTFHTNKYNFLFKYSSIYNSNFWKKYNTPVPAGLFKKALLDLEKGKSLDVQFRENSLGN